MWETLLTVLVSQFCFATWSVEAAGSWGYQNNYYGPQYWDGVCKTGEQQSPIDIKTGEATLTNLGQFTFHNYKQDMRNGEVTNNGHSLKLSPPTHLAQYTPSISGGGLDGHYVFAQVHAHWGNYSQVGSEHTVNGVFYPIELHLVHYNAKYGSLGDAVGKSDGLAVLGVLYYLTPYDNPHLAPLIDSATSVMNAKDKANLNQNLKLEDLLPHETATFYRYMGSLTTPTCNEVVTWTVFNGLDFISENQLNKLRALGDSSGFKMGNNYRPVQSLNRRIVLKSDPKLSGCSVPGQHPVSPPAQQSSTMMMMLMAMNNNLDQSTKNMMMLLATMGSQMF